MTQPTENPIEQEDTGLTAYQNGDFAAAYRAWLTLAQAGHAQACHNIAILHLNGQGVAEDFAQAQYWCEKSAQAGHAPAQHHLALMLAESDPATATDWLEKAAEQGLADAQFTIGEHYRLGRHRPADLDTAADWYEAAALQGHPNAQYNLGVLYANAGHFAQARHWWTQSPDNPEAQQALARLTELGH